MHIGTHADFAINSNLIDRIRWCLYEYQDKSGKIKIHGKSRFRKNQEKNQENLKKKNKKNQEKTEKSEKLKND